jgi:transaldolase
LYVDSLIAPDTISTLPVETLKLFEDHGTVSRTLNHNSGSEGRRLLDALASAGIDFDDVNRTLEREGIEKFVKSYDSLLGVVAKKRRALTR